MADDTNALYNNPIVNALLGGATAAYGHLGPKIANHLLILQELNRRLIYHLSYQGPSGATRLLRV